jgi:DNA topoisomerase-1
MEDESFRVLAGECTVSFVTESAPEEAEETEETATTGETGKSQGGDRRAERGAVLVVEKPDGTVLVHDRDGYRPVAWLTRADAVAWDRTGPAPALSAVQGDRRLEVTCHDEFGRGCYPASRSGDPVGICPACGSVLVHVAGAVTCLGCGVHHGVPRDATILADGCPACGLPRMAVERGDAFEVCVDRTCESLDDAIRARFDRTWSCPDCGDDLRIIRRGGLLAGCDGYPDCERAYALPAGVVDGDCETCRLPVFETTAGRRCLDAACEGS